jgi:hypothetical protein
VPEFSPDSVERWLESTLRDHAYGYTKLAFAFVFFYFGLQKWPMVQGASPVRPPVAAFVEAMGFGGPIPLAPAVGLLLIGVYEVSLGLLWVGSLVEERLFAASNVFVLVTVLTVFHQTVTFLPLVAVPTVAFRQTTLWIPGLATVPFPVALDWLSAFIFKNQPFLGAFAYVFVEWRERYRGGGDPESAVAPGALPEESEPAPEPVD